VNDSKKYKANKPKETGSQEKPDYQAPRTYEHLLLMGPNVWAVFGYGSNDIELVYKSIDKRTKN
jgi:hypothetical protein